MVGIEFKSASDPYTPAPEGYQIPAKIGSRVQAKCMEKNLMTLTTSVYDTLRIIAPLNISEGEMKEGMDILEAAIREVALEG